MRTIIVSVSIGLVGCRRETTIEVEDDDDDDAIETQAREAMFDMIDWDWREADKK